MPLRDDEEVRDGKDWVGIENQGCEVTLWHLSIICLVYFCGMAVIKDRSSFRKNQKQSRFNEMAEMVNEYEQMYRKKSLQTLAVSGRWRPRGIPPSQRYLRTEITSYLPYPFSFV